MEIFRYLPQCFFLALVLVPGVEAAQGDHVHIASLEDINRAEWKLPVLERKPEALITLGETLFFDKRLSGDNTIACSTCHDPALGWADGRAFSYGFNGEKLKRSTPTILNSVFQATQMWDGRAATLFKQAMLPIEAENEMNMQAGGLAGKLGAIPGYNELFKAAFGDPIISTFRISKALAAFEETIVSSGSRFDEWLAGDNNALTEDEKAGFLLFLQQEKGACADCHHAPNFSDDGFHNVGTSDMARKDADLGRYEIVPIASMRGAFKTPGLRDIALTAPYFHDGSAQSLEDVVELYRLGGRYKKNLSPNMRKANLTEKEKAQLVQFLHALTSKNTGMD